MKLIRIIKNLVISKILKRGKFLTLFFLSLIIVITIYIIFIFRPKQRLVAEFNGFESIKFKPGGEKKQPPSALILNGEILLIDIEPRYVKTYKEYEKLKDMMEGFELAFAYNIPIEEGTNKKAQLKIFDEPLFFSGEYCYKEFKKLLDQLNPIYFEDALSHQSAPRRLRPVTLIKRPEDAINLEIIRPDTTDAIKFAFRGKESERPSEIYIKQPKMTPFISVNFNMKEGTNFPRISSYGGTSIFIIPYSSRTEIYNNYKNKTYLLKSKMANIIISISDLGDWALFPSLSKLPSGSLKLPHPFKVVLKVYRGGCKLPNSVSNVFITGTNGLIKYGLKENKVDYLDDIEIGNGVLSLKYTEESTFIIKGYTNNLSINGKRISESYWNMLNANIQAAIIGTVLIVFLGWIIKLFTKREKKKN